MTDHERKGKDLLSQADKKLHSVGGLFGSLFGGSEKVDDAVELYAKAGNAFKMAKNWKAAGDAFCKAAALEIKCKSNHQAASQYVEAANCYRKTNTSEAVKILQRAIEIYTDMGKFRIAAKHHVTTAEIFEKEDANIPKAILHYEMAADYYKGEESSCAANKCLVKVAQFAAEAEQYDKAIAIYEKIAMSGMDNRLLRYGAKDYYFRAALCRMCNDVQDASNAIHRYEDMFPAFGDSRECILLKQLIAACSDQDSNSFDNAVAEFTRFIHLDNWYQKLLQRIGKGLEAEYDLK